MGRKVLKRTGTAADDTDYTDGAIVIAFIRVIGVIRGFKFPALKRAE